MRARILIVLTGLSLGAAACATVEAPTTTPPEAVSSAPAPVDGYDWFYHLDDGEARALALVHAHTHAHVHAHQPNTPGAPLYLADWLGLCLGESGDGDLPQAVAWLHRWTHEGLLLAKD